MNNRPDYKDFYIKNRRLLRKKNVEYVYMEYKTSKLYIEVNAYRNRIIHEIKLNTIPLAFFIGSLVLPVTAIPYPIVYSLIAVVLYIAINHSFKNRFLRTKFTEVSSYKESQDSAVRLVEYFLYCGSILGLILLVLHMILMIYFGIL